MKAALALMGIVAFATALAGCVSHQAVTTSPIVQTSRPPASATIAPAFVPPGMELDFQTIVEPSQFGGEYPGKTSRIDVVTSPDGLPPQGWLSWRDRDLLATANYQGAVLIIVFNGSNAIFGYLRVRGVWRDGAVIYVTAHFNEASGATSTALPAVSSQYQVLKIWRSQLLPLGQYTFRLLDETGRERASTVAEISSGYPPP